MRAGRGEKQGKQRDVLSQPSRAVEPSVCACGESPAEAHAPANRNLRSFVLSFLGSLRTSWYNAALTIHALLLSTCGSSSLVRMAASAPYRCTSRPTAK